MLLTHGAMSVRWVMALGLVVLHGTACFTDPLASVTDPDPDAPPNVILIVTDDQDARSLAFMPHVMNDVAGEGALFTRAYVTLAICCPSRASILTGQYPHNHGVLDNDVGPRAHLGGYRRFFDLGRETSTIATWLQAAGYRTGLFGKYLNGYINNPRIPPGWTRWFAAADRGNYYGGRYNDDGKLVAFGERPRDYETDVLAREAIAFMTDAVVAGEPFFAFIAPFAPHRPPVPAGRHIGAFASLSLSRSPSFNEADVSDKPGFIRESPLLDAAEIAEIDDLHRQRLESLLAVDEMVGSIVELLRRANRLRSTYIIYTSDNGFHMGEHRLPPQKGRAYEEDILVPLVMSGPGVKPGIVLDHMTLNNDLAPTIAELAGIPVPSSVDGRSFLPLLDGRGPGPDAWRQHFFIEVFERYRAVRGRDFLFVRWTAGQDIEYYDMPSDPYQIESLVRWNPVTRQLEGSLDSARLAELDALTAALAGCAGPSCRIAEDGPFTP